jgi:hypothetical protein
MSDLMRALSAILPSPGETRLLQACLLSGDRARVAWAASAGQRGHVVHLFREDTRGLKMLGPLLNRAMHRNSLSAAPTVLTVLRTAQLREELRSREYRRILGHVLSTLAVAEIPTVVLQGAALSELVYDDPSLRHSHDVELLLDEADLPRAASVLAAAGLGQPVGASLARVFFEHPSGLPVVLQSELFGEAFCGPRTNEVWAASERCEIAGVAARVLSRLDNLLHVCGRASYFPTRDSLLWICDAWLLTTHGSGLDWDQLIERATASRLLLPVDVVLGYLVRELEAPVPGPVLARLHAAAAAVDSVTLDVALFGARASGRSGLAGLLRAAGGWQERLRLLHRLLFPSAAYMRHAYHVAGTAWLPLYYIYRPLSYLCTRLRLGLERIARGPRHP